jgi:ribonucleoside-diphosphate reductase alpha chain
LLGSINLFEFITNPFTDRAYFNYDDFCTTVEQSVVALNEVLHEGLPLHPLQEQKESVNNWRQIGLGIFGWHDALIKLGVRYGDKESIKLADNIGFALSNIAITTSANLVDRYGTYPMYDYNAVSQSPFYIENTDDITKAIVKTKGLANSQLLTVPPTGSIATMLGVSTALEPIYNISYTRKTESLHGKDTYYKVYTPIVEQYMKARGIENEEDLPDFINTAMTLNYKERIEMQSAWQHSIDASISSTVNVPNDFTVEETENLYMLAWEKGLKGVTIFRDGCARLGILTNDTKKEEDKPKQITIPRGFIESVPEDLVYRKYKLKTGCGNLYFFVGVDEVDNKIYDCFTNTDGVGGCTINTQANSRLLSAALRGGVPVEYLIEQLNKAGTCPSFQYKKGKGEPLSKGKSCSSAIANILKDILKEFEIDEDKQPVKVVENKPKKQISNEIVNQMMAVHNSNKCPECGEELKNQGGCNICNNCGYSRCDA